MRPCAWDESSLRIGRGSIYSFHFRRMKHLIYPDRDVLLFLVGVETFSQVIRSEKVSDHGCLACNDGLPQH